MPRSQSCEGIPPGALAGRRHPFVWTGRIHRVCGARDGGSDEEQPKIGEEVFHECS